MTSRNYIVAALAACACAALPSASAAPDERITLKHQRTNMFVRAARIADTCTLNIMQISDGRFYKDGVGLDRSIPTEPPQPWVASSLETLAEYGFTVHHSETPLPAAINLNVSLIRAYTWMGDSRINGMVAVDVTLPQLPGAPVEKFRSTSSTINMRNANSEYVDTLNFALNDIVAKMALALQKRCQNAGLARN
jgi:hypothetical protein